MKHFKIFLAPLILALSLWSCDLLQSSGGGEPGVSDEEISSGLKEALRVGTDTCISKVTRLDGYYNDALIKMLMPQEMQVVVDKFQTLIGAGGTNGTIANTIYNATVGAVVDDFVVSLNRSAEDAAKTAKPILVNAITGMSITDARDILFGEDTAATNYLRVNTFESLKSAYTPKIDSSLNKVLVGSKSSNQLYNDFASAYNTARNHTLNNNFACNNCLGLEPLGASTLGEYAVKKALTGLFIKVSQEEKQIRDNPIDRVTDLLVKVFGLLD